MPGKTEFMTTQGALTSTIDPVAFRDGVHAARPAAGNPQPNAVLLMRRTA